MVNLIYINEEVIKKPQIAKFKYINEAVIIFEKLIEDYGSHIENTKVIPCTVEDIEVLESKLSSPFKLPASYKEFLLYGGKKMAGISGLTNIFYGEAKLLLEYPNEAYDLFCDEELEGLTPPPEIFFLTEYLGAYAAYFRLDEGEDPPVYEWKEKYGNELDIVKKSDKTFSNFLKAVVISYLLLKRKGAIDKNINDNNPPRGKQFWVVTNVDLLQGITYEKQMDALGFTQYIQLEKAASLSGLTPYPYLEELSGWKARRVGDEVRFFPPSYESPEEKDREVLEQQSRQLEEQKQELAKIEKTIANLQGRIKNLSGGKLTGGINFKNTSASRIKELEKELRKQKIAKQKLGKESIKLEENIN